MKTKKYLNVLHSFTLHLIGLMDIEELIWYVTEEVAGKLGYHDCVVSLYDAQREVIVQKVAIGPKYSHDRQIKNPLETPIGSNIVGMVGLTKTATLVNDMSDNDLYMDDLKKPGSGLYVPICHNGILYGIIDSEHENVDYFTQGDLQIFTEIANLMGAKFAQIALIETENLQSKIIETIQDIVILCDGEGRIRYANEAIQNVTGYSYDEFLSMNILDLIICEESQKPINQKTEFSQWANKHWNGRVLLKHHDDDLHHYDLLSTPQIGKDGKFQGSISVLRNVDHVIKNECEQKLHAIVFENVNDGIVMFDINAKIIDSNHNAQKMMGYSHEEMMGMTSMEFAANKEDWKQKQLDAFSSIAATGKYIGEGRAKHVDGNEFPFEISMTLYHDKNNMPLGTVAVMRDVTEQKIQLAKLQAAKNDAEAANAEKSKFLATMSHEIRTPLNAVIGFAEALEMGVGADNAESRNESLRIIADAGRMLNNLISDILDFSKLEMGRVDYMLEPVWPSDIFKKNLPIIRQLAEKGSIKFNGIKKTDKKVFVDRARLEQILLNLITNAVKYNKPNGMIEFGCYDIDDDHLRIYIKDSGVGIPKDKEGLLFAPFERSNNHNPDIAGIGLGLSICKNLTEAMDGTIGFESEYGVGSTFWVDFPVFKET